jgi:hypothetical protein
VPAEVILRVLQHLWVTLQSMNVPMAVMGGIAVSTWKHVRATRDVDLLIGVRASDVDLMMQRLSEAGFRPKHSPAILNLGELHLVQLLYEPPDAYVDVQVDLLLAESDYHMQALGRRVPVQLPDLDIEVSVLACEDLILHKLLAGRIIDRADVAALLRANRAALDMPYLLPWAKNLNLEADLTSVWEEAFPGETPPPITP